MTRCTQETHEAVKADLRTFQAATVRLPGRSVEAIVPGGDEGEFLVLRNCNCCQSTLAYTLGLKDIL